MMERMNRTRTFLSVFLAAALILSCSCHAFAEQQTNANVISGEEIQMLFDRYVKEYDLNPNLISIAFCYPATGEEWFYQEDKWYYSASLYKVPLMMLLAEKVSDPAHLQESEINGLPLEEIEEAVLQYSDNDLAYSMLLYLGEPSAARAMYRRYSNLPDEYFDWSFYGSSYFTARFMNDVMKTLYERKEDFPGVIEHLLMAQPEHFFKAKISAATCEIAQKYGSYHDEDENDWNHTSGIFFTENPFILTVMTRYGGMSETIIADLAVVFHDYAVSADKRLAELNESGR